MPAATAIDDSAVSAMLERERSLFVRRNPKSKALAHKTRRHWLEGVPMIWMADWSTPHQLFISRASGVKLVDVDDNTYIDFCLGDTGAMFGHAPAAVRRTLGQKAKLGMSTMLPSPDAAVVGGLLAERFGLPVWQVTATASDANRAVIRWMRAISGRKKILVFNRCYHGAVDETFITFGRQGTAADPGLIGEPRNLGDFAKVVEFNDVAGLDAALAARDVACVLTEPVMTNCGMVLPAEGFHDSLRKSTRDTGTFLVIDETHTLSSGPGGYTHAHGLDPDAMVLGKPIAGGIPAAVYGFTQEVSTRIADYLKTRTPGHSGVGTTLSGSPIQLALMRTMLETFFTKQTFRPMIGLAERLERGIAKQIKKFRAPWHVVRVGARVEFMCTPHPPRNGGEASGHIHRPVDLAVHHYLLNRGLVITPFHNMMLISPSTRKSHVDALVEAIGRCLKELTSA